MCSIVAGERCLLILSRESHALNLPPPSRKLNHEEAGVQLLHCPDVQTFNVQVFRLGSIGSNLINRDPDDIFYKPCH